MLSRLDKFNTGPDVARRKLNAMIDEINRLGKLVGDDYIHVNNTIGGRTVGLNFDTLAARISRPSSASQVDTSLVAHYSFDTNVATDISGNGYDGTYGGGMGSPRDVAEFDGADDHIDCGAVDFLGIGPLTITCNLRLESWGELLLGHVISNDKTILMVDTGGAFKRLKFTSDGATFVSFTTDSLTLHKWYYIAVTRTAAGAAILYVDGVQDATGASGTPAAGTANVYIGNNVATTRAYHGQMDDFRIYNRVFTATEIKQVYNKDQKNFIHADEVFGAAHIFEVQHAATAGGDGIYDCYEQTLDATEWADTAGDSKVDNLNTTEVEVLNIAEFDPEATYVAHLAAGDLLVAFRAFGGYDDEGGSRWVGMPFRQGAHGAGVRLAYCSEAAPADNTITATLDHTTGTAITVTCHIAGGAALNAAIPRLADNDEIFVIKIGGTWYCTTVFQASEDCDCYSA